MRTHSSASGLLFLLACCCLLAGPAVFGVEATVVDLKGKVGFGPTKDGPWKPLAKDARLGEQVFVRTAEASSVVLKIEGEAVVTVHELSEVYLKNLGRQQETDKNLVMLLFGKLWAKVTKQEGEAAGNFSVHTPAAIAAVRGTEYYVESDPQTKNSRIGVWEGSVGVFAQRDKERREGVIVEAGFMIEVVFNEPPSRVKMLKMEQARIQEQQQFNQQVSSLGLTNVLGGGAVEMAKIDEARTAEARDQLKDAISTERGRKKAEEDYAKIARALAKLQQDTGFLPGAGKRKTSDKTTTLKCLLASDDGAGNPIDKWAGPYLEGNLLDPWGQPYGVYQRQQGDRLMGIFLHSNGPNKSRGDEDDVESYFAVSRLQALLKE